MEEKAEAEREDGMGFLTAATQVAAVGTSGSQTSLPPPLFCLDIGVPDERGK